MKDGLAIAEKADLANCAAIIHQAFPVSLRMRSYSLCLKWILKVYESPHAELHVCREDGLVLGLGVLVTNEKLFAVGHKRDVGTWVSLLLIGIRNPRIAVLELRRKAALRRELSCQKARNKVRIKHGGCRAWVELTAVSAKARRRGIGRRINMHLEKRAYELGFRFIERNIEPTNMANRSLVEKLGYIQIGRSGSGYTYSKELYPLESHNEGGMDVGAINEP